MAVWDDDWVELRRFSRLPEANADALVLTARGIACRLQPTAAGIGLFVPRADAAPAHAELTAYAKENRRLLRPPPPPTRPIEDGIAAALVAIVSLVAVQGFANRDFLATGWFDVGSAWAERITDGAWWRTITALALHGDAGHLASNLAIGAVFGLLLAQTLGGGLAFLGALVGGALGNLANALVQAPEHTSIGASTAVFAILGLMTTLAWRREVLFSRRGLMRTMLPLVAGATLLSMLGTGGERTDVGAHIFGFLAGGGLGLLLHAVRHILPMGARAQIGYGAAALVIFSVAWVFAFAVG